MSPKWKGLRKIDRVELLLVSEWVKSWAIIGWNQTTFLEFLQRLDLEYSYTTDPKELNPIFRVARKAYMDSYFRDLLTLWDDHNENAYDYINGHFLWYPGCCINEYCNPSKNIIQRRMMSPETLISNFTFESIKNWWYSNEFDYCPSSFTPCSIYCEEAKRMLSKRMGILNDVDIEASDMLVEINKKSHLRDEEGFEWMNIPGKVKKILIPIAGY